MGMQQDDKAIVARLEQIIERKLGGRAKYDEDGQLITLGMVQCKLKSM